MDVATVRVIRRRLNGSDDVPPIASYLSFLSSVTFWALLAASCPSLLSAPYK